MADNGHHLYSVGGMTGRFTWSRRRKSWSPLPRTRRPGWRTARYSQIIPPSFTCWCIPLHEQGRQRLSVPIYFQVPHCVSKANYCFWLWISFKSSIARTGSIVWKIIQGFESSCPLLKKDFGKNYCPCPLLKKQLPQKCSSCLLLKKQIKNKYFSCLLFMTTTKWNGYRNLTATKMCLQAPKLAHKMCS